jgi:hypothetical protein
MTNPTTCTRCNGHDRLAIGEDAHWRGCLRGEDGRALCVRCEGTGEEPPCAADCDCDACCAAYDLAHPTTDAAIAA